MLRSGVWLLHLKLKCTNSLERGCMPCSGVQLPSYEAEIPLQPDCLQRLSDTLHSSCAVLWCAVHISGASIDSCAKTLLPMPKNMTTHLADCQSRTSDRGLLRTVHT